MGKVLEKNIMKKALAYLEFIRPRNIIFGLILLFSGIFVGGNPPWISFQVLAALLSFSFAIAGNIAFNNYVDRDIDKIIHPKRPLPSGLQTAFGIKGILGKKT